MFSIRGKVAIITGASGGIGLGTAELFAEAGAKLILVARRCELLEEVCARLHAMAQPRLHSEGQDGNDVHGSGQPVTSDLSYLGRT